MRRNVLNSLLPQGNIRLLLLMLYTLLQPVAFAGPMYNVLTGATVLDKNGRTEWNMGEKPYVYLHPDSKCGTNPPLLPQKCSATLEENGNLINVKLCNGGASGGSLGACVYEASVNEFRNIRPKLGATYSVKVGYTFLGQWQHDEISRFVAAKGYEDCSFDISSPTIDAGYRIKSNNSFILNLSTITATCTTKASVYIRVAQKSDKDVSVKINGYLNGSGMNLKESVNVIPVQLSTSLAKKPGKYEHIIVIAMTIN